jgi:hypothetical protein
MNKAQTKQLENVKLYIANDMRDTAARALSAMIRASLVRKTAHELHAFAVEHQLHVEPEFII